MSQLTNGTNLTGTITLSKQSETVVTLRTSGNYLDKSVVLSLQAQTATPAFSGAGIINQSATASFTNATVSTSNLAGVAVQPSAAAGRASAVYANDVNGWVSKSTNAEAFPALSTSSWSGGTYYITGVNIGVGKAFDVTLPVGSESSTVHFNVLSTGLEMSGLPVATVSETLAFMGL